MKLPASTIIWLLVAALCHHVADVDSEDADNQPAAVTWKTPGGQLLAGPDFRVNTRAWTLKPGGLFLFRDEIITQEFYSNSQRRALVELYRVGRTDRQEADLHSTYHYQHKQIIQNPTGFREKCSPIDPDQLAKDLLGAELKVSNVWLRAKVAVPEYIVGLARLLFIVDYYRDAFVEPIQSSASSIRNQKTISYELPIKMASEWGLEGTLRVRYAETRQHYGGFDLPMRIQFLDKDGSILSIDYSLIGPIENDLVEQVDSLYPLDRFAIPVGIGCSEKMAPIGQRLPIQVASFQAEIFKHNRLGTKQTSVSRRFVAYDSYAGAMRSDAITPVSYSVTIIDLWNKRKFTIMQEDGTNDGQFMKRPCVAAEPDLYLGLLPLEELVYMGQATIRGVECSVFEHTTSKLPPALFPSLTFTNLERKEESLFARNSDTYQVVYYFAISQTDDMKRRLVVRDAPSGPLMRIDVYSKRGLQYHMDVFDYANQLNDAPNGDRQEELFALKDRCSTGQLERDGYASLTLELTYRPASAKPQTAQQALQTLQAHHLRDKATLRALARGSPGIITKLSDLETEMRLSPGGVDGGGQLRIYVEARLNLPDVALSKVRQVGWSTYKSESTYIKTIEECFQFAAHAQTSSGPILFVSCADFCSIDHTPIVEYGKDNEIKSIISDIYKADLRKTPSSRSCPTMLVESGSQAGKSASRVGALRTTYNWIRSDFEGKILRLLMPHQGSYDVSLDDLMFEVTQVDVNNDKWSVALGYEKAHQDDDDDGDGSSLFKLPARGLAAAIEGLGLTEATGQLEQARQREDSDEGPTMSYQICHSICMAKLDCRSFSVCLTRLGIECITSGIDFRDRTLIKEIESKLGQEQQSKTAAKTIIKVANPIARQQRGGDHKDNDDSTPNAMGLIELKVDFRCKLYKKNVLEMFHKLRPSSVGLRDSLLTPVGSLEECAEICFRNNMVFFERTAAAKAELMQNNNEAGSRLDEELTRRLREQYNSNLMKWCSTFYFIGISSPHLKTPEAQASISPEKLEKAGGLCVNPRSFDSTDDEQDKKSPAGSDKDSGDKNPGSESETMQAEKVGPRVPFETFEFLNSNLFDVQYGIQLKAAKKDKEDKPLALINMSRREYAQNAESCARRCFLQMCGLYPMCKSFDFVETRTRSQTLGASRTTVKTYCDFHTLSLAEIRLNGMAELMVTDLSSGPNETDSSDTSIQSWHYDSRESYTLAAAVLSEQVLVKSEANQLLLNHIQTYRLHALGVTMLLLAALILSAAIVVLHGHRIASRVNFKRRESITDPSRSFLSTLVSGSSHSSSSAATVGRGIRHERFVAGDQDLPNITDLTNPL